VENSIVRRGNHFIRLEGEWCLIDGPWFEYLKRLSRGCFSPVRTEVVDPHPRWYNFRDFNLEFGVCINPHYLDWEQRRWYPSHVNPFANKRWASFRELWLHDRWQKWMGNRVKMGFVLLPFGRLPEFIDMEIPDDADGHWWWDAWDYERGTSAQWAERRW